MTKLIPLRPCRECPLPRDTADFPGLKEDGDRYFIQCGTCGHAAGRFWSFQGAIADWNAEQSDALKEEAPIAAGSKADAGPT